MKTLNTRNILIIVLILLIMVNISALFTIVYKNRVKQAEFSKYTEMQEKVRSEGMNRFFRDELKLSEEQFSRFREINESNMLKSREIVRRLNELRFEMIMEIAKDNPDNKALDQIASEIGEQHYQLKQNTIGHFMELKAICTPEQQKVLHGMFIEMLDRQDNQDMNRRGMHNRGKRERPSRSRN